MSKPTDALGMGMPQPALFGVGKEQTDAMVNMQKELLAAYEQASRSWLARVKSEMELWSELAEKLGRTQSLPEALGAYQQCVAQRVQMAAEDGQRLFEEYQTLMQKMTRPFSENGPRGGT
jgi:Phasin protein